MFPATVADIVQLQSPTAQLFIVPKSRLALGIPGANNIDTVGDFVRARLPEDEPDVRQ